MSKTERCDQHEVVTRDGASPLLDLCADGAGGTTKMETVA
jgi:hypothetical protein